MGTQRIMTELVGPHYVISHYASQPFSCDMPLSTNDFFVVCGSPWLWDGAGLSKKYNILRSAISLFSARKLVIYGVGSSYIIGKPHPSAKHAADLLRMFDVVVCRDRHAVESLKEEGIDSMLLPCPAYTWGQQIQVGEKTEKTCLVFTGHNRRDGSPSAKYCNQGIIDQFDQLQHELVNGERATTMTMTVPDHEEFIRRFGKTPDYHSTNPLNIARFLGQFQETYSGRVHGAIVAQSVGSQAWLCPIDTRAATAVHVGAKLLFGLDSYQEFAGLADLSKIDLEEVKKSLSGRLLDRRPE